MFGLHSIPIGIAKRGHAKHVARFPTRQHLYVLLAVARHMSFVAEPAATCHI